MGGSRWHMNRLGLVDFWCYENDEFHFQNGHMLLRGSNGSGKSVTMQSFIPLLLDGNKSSERLDPFGTRSRRMETYLIDENSDREERIGYLYLEFKRAESELYTTIGMGLRARKNKPLESWYFVIEDNRRVNIDFSLMENHLTLSKRQLENLLGSQVIHTQLDYMKKVNEVLFGFPHLDDYKDAIDLLLQLRSPKLSNSLSPSKINEILANSLQPLSEDDLRPMSEAIASMDHLQDELQNLNISLNAAKKISQAYNTYNKAILIDKWQKYYREKEIYDDKQKMIQENQNQLLIFKQALLTKKEALKENKIRLEVLLNEKSNLSNPQIERLHDDVTALQKEVGLLEKQISLKQEQADIKENKIIDAKNNIKKYEDEIGYEQIKQQQILKELEYIVESYPISEHSVLKEALLQNKEYDFEYAKGYLKQERNEVQKLKNEYAQYENIQEQLTSIDSQIVDLKEQLSSLEYLMDQKNDEYRNCITDYQEYFYAVFQQNQMLKMSTKNIQEMVKALLDYETHHDYQMIKSYIHKQYFEQVEILTKQQGTLELQMQGLQSQYNQTMENVQYWLNKQDFEPERSALSQKQRAYLNSLHIPYKPLFELLDFEDQVNDEQKNRIEEIFAQMHILDAIVIEDKYKEEIKAFKQQGHDYYLWTHENLNELKSVYLSYPFDQNQLASLCKQLSIAVPQGVVISDSYFVSGILEGNMDQCQEASFIGYEKRKLLREKKIESYQNELQLLKEKIQELEELQMTLQDNLVILKEEYNAFRNEEKLKEAYHEIEKCQKELNFVHEQIKKMDVKKESKHQEALHLFSQIKQQCNHLLIEVSKEAILNREDLINQYQEALEQLKDVLQKLSYFQQLHQIEENNLEEVRFDANTLRSEIMEAKDKLDLSKSKIISIHQQLEDLGYADIQRKLYLIEQELNQLNQTIQQINDDMIRIETKQAHIEDKLLEDQQELDEQTIKTKKYQEILDQELAYGFVVQDKDYKTLKQLNSQFSFNKTVSEYLGNLQSVFFEQVSFLAQYRLTHEIDGLVHEMEDVNGHFMIKANHQGQKVYFQDLLAILETKIETQKLLIQEEDRRIFEEILVNTIGKKIRNRIQTSKRWVEKMERYMQDMNTSSGLQLGLKWRSKKAMDDEELDTQKLVELLEKDYRLLKENDRLSISQHFRSKIETARRMSSDENSGASFHQLMKEVMDYRQWFEFTLYAKKPNESKKELTNRVFYAYSGGEKAIAMYVPLFSSVAAKFESAKEDAPHLIALDEAFAGVDENNIDNLFELITKFDFDYIMNSQFLWGDYPSCKSLGIYELFRPNNAPYVTKIAYVWNGHVRKVKFS